MAETISKPTSIPAVRDGVCVCVGLAAFRLPHHRQPPLATPFLGAGGFVIDEDGLGYADVGEEIDWGVAEEQQQGDGGAAGKAGKGAAAGAKRKAAAEPVPRARARMQKMFHTAQAKSKPRAAVDDASADALLDDILGNLGSGPVPGGGSSRCKGHGTV